jgi:hypothetical protein
MNVTRRELLAVIGAGTAVSGYVGWCIGRNWKGSPQKSIRGEFEYAGLPEILKKANFECRQKTRRDTSPEVIIFAEQRNDDVIRVKESLVIDFLVKYHGFDAIGLAALYGPPSSKLPEIVKKEFHEFFEQKTWFRDGNDNLHYLIKVPGLGPLGKYALQESVPTFGIEDKMLFFESLALRALITQAASINHAREKNVIVGGDLIPYGDVPNIANIELLYEVISRKFPDIPYPGDNMWALSLSMGGRASDFKRFAEYYLEVEQGRSNLAEGAIIAQQMGYLGSERTAIVTRDSDVLLPRELLVQIGEHNFRKGYNPKFKTLQGCLPHSAMVINATRNPTKRRTPTSAPSDSLVLSAYANRHA